MKENKLQITTVEQQHNSAPNKISKAARRQEIQATMDRMWNHDPEQFDPERDCVQRKRIHNTIEAMRKHIGLQGKFVADLGCGGGVLSRLMRNSGAQVHAVDVSPLALDKLKSYPMEDIKAIQDCLPNTLLHDNVYDVVVCTEVIGYLKQQEYRMAFSEMARIVKTEGYVVCSTPLDIDSENALERFSNLAETEFEIDKWFVSYDLLWMRLCRFFEAPRNYSKASGDPSYRAAELAKRKPLGRRWFSFNSSRVLGPIWYVVSILANPFAYFVRQNTMLMTLLEKAARFFWYDTGVSHALFIGRRRKMTFPLPANEIPKEMKHKRQVWE